MRNPDFTNTFEKGMNRDYNPKLQPKGTTRLVVNGVYLSEDGDVYSITNEKGTEVFVTLPTGYKDIGSYTLDKDIILFLVNPLNGFSQIGYIDSFTGVYNKVLPVTGENSDLRFSIDHPIDVQGRKIFTGDRIIYWTDNNSPYAYLNLDSPPDSDIFAATRINPLMTLPVVDYIETLETGGQLHGGVYQFVAQYLTKELNPMGYGIPCNPIPVTPNKRADGRNNYEGAYPDNPATIAKSIRVNITNLDDKFPFLQLVAIHYDTITNTFTANTVSPVLSIATGQANIMFDYNGDDSKGTPVLINEINSIPLIYSKAKCIEQKDDTLIFSNLSLTSERYNLQEVANNIITKYAIQEVPYVDGLQGNASSFVVLNPPFIDDTSATWDFFIDFSQFVDVTSATTVTNYKVIYDPNFPGTFINPISVEVDSSNPNRIIAHMDSGVPAQELFVGVQVNISNIQNFDLTQTIATQTFTIITNTSSASSPNLFFADYKDEGLTFNGKSLMREEIYSLGFGVMWMDGSQSPVYPIPGNDKITTTTTNADVPSKTCGTYVSSIDYPSGQGYPAGKVRHHKMPTLQQEPHYRVDTAGNTFIRILGLTFQNIIIPANVRADIQSIFFVRQSRNIPQNRSIVAQGVVNNMVFTSNNYKYDSGAPDGNSSVYKKNPFFNNFTYTNTTAAAPFSGGKSVALSIGGPITDTGALFSPDFQLGNADPTEITKLKNVLLIKGAVETTKFQKSQNRNQITIGSKKVHLYKPLQLWLFGNYTDVDTSSFTPTESTITASGIVNNGEKKRVTNVFPSYDIDNTDSGKFYLFRTATSFVTNSPSNVHVTFNVNIDASPGPAQIKDNHDDIGVSPNLFNYLYNFYKDNPSQYGPIDATEYAFMAQSLNPNITDYTTFNGDVFISKYSYGNKENWSYKGLYATLTLAVPSTNYQFSDTDEPLGTNLKGAGLRTLGYFFVESPVNCNYRHQFIPNGVKYFPKYNQLDTLAEDPWNGDASSYNTQYSYENRLRSFVSKPAVFFNTSGYETRSIYSQKATLGETVDSYRIFPPNNFYDIPKHTGEIWDSFVENNILYLHTPKSLWRTFMNEVTQQTTDTTQIILGTSGLFTIPAKQVFTEKGGYAGTISQWGGVHTPGGYIFPDSLQGKLFLLADQSISEISADGMTRYLNDNLSVLGVGDNYYIDNPFNPNSKGLHGVYDYETKRYILSKYHSNSNERWTLSYSLLLNSFASFHTYIPNRYISINNKFYSINNSENQISLHQHNVGAYGSFYGVVDPTTIQIVINKEPRFDKSFDSLGINMETIDENTGQFISIRPSGDTAHFYTFNKHSGEISLKYDNSIYANKASNEELVRFKGQRYQLQISPNSIVNDSLAIFDNSTLFNDLLGKVNLGNVNQNALFRGRMKGQFIVANLTFNNQNNYKNTVSMIDSNFRVNNI